MTSAIAPMITRYFSRSETAGGQGKLSLWKRAPVRFGDRDAAGPLVAVPGVEGNVAPLVDADLDITDSAGQKREGHLQVFSLSAIQVADEATGEHSMWILHKGYYYFMEEQSDWDYAKGFVYRATRDRRASNV